MRLIILDQENDKMQVGIEGEFYSDLDGSQLDSTIHAVQWYDTHGEIERQDASTLAITANENITDASPYQFAIDLWVVAKRQAVYQEAYNSAYATAIEAGDSESDADAAGITAGNTAKNAYVAPTL
jgi:hypothetical protein